MKINIPYGKEEIDLDLPENNILDIISGETSVSVSDEKEVVSKAIANPVGSALLSEMARGKTSACILASDITRPSPSYKFLPELVAELESGGIGLKDIKVVLGLGIHRGHTDDENKYTIWKRRDRSGLTGKQYTGYSLGRDFNFS